MTRCTATIPELTYKHTFPRYAPLCSHARPTIEDTTVSSSTYIYLFNRGRFKAFYKSGNESIPLRRHGWRQAAQKRSLRIGLGPEQRGSDSLVQRVLAFWQLPDLARRMAPWPRPRMHEADRDIAPFQCNFKYACPRQLVLVLWCFDICHHNHVRLVHVDLLPYLYVYISLVNMHTMYMPNIRALYTCHSVQYIVRIPRLKVDRKRNLL